MTRFKVIEQVQEDSKNKLILVDTENARTVRCADGSSYKRFFVIRDGELNELKEMQRFADILNNKKSAS